MLKFFSGVTLTAVLTYVYQKYHAAVLWWLFSLGDE